MLLRVKAVLGVPSATAPVKLINPRLVYVTYSVALLVQVNKLPRVKTAQSQAARSVCLKSQVSDFCVAEVAMLLHSFSDEGIADI